MDTVFFSICGHFTVVSYHNNILSIHVNQITGLQSEAVIFLNKAMVCEAIGITGHK